MLHARAHTYAHAQDSPAVHGTLQAGDAARARRCLPALNGNGVQLAQGVDDGLAELQHVAAACDPTLAPAVRSSVSFAAGARAASAMPSTSALDSFVSERIVSVRPCLNRRVPAVSYVATNSRCTA